VPPIKQFDGRRLNSRLSPEQHKCLEILALGAGMSKSDVVREVLCNPDNGDAVRALIDRRVQEKLLEEKYGDHAHSS
jgi:hypothetical protein